MGFAELMELCPQPQLFQSSAPTNTEAIPCCVSSAFIALLQKTQLSNSWEPGVAYVSFNHPLSFLIKALNRTGSWHDLILFVFIFVYCHSLIGKKLNRNKAFAFFLLGLPSWCLSWSMGNELIWIILMHLIGGAWVSKGKEQPKPRVSSLECLSKQDSKPASKQAGRHQASSITHISALLEMVCMQELDCWEPKGIHNIPFGMYSCGVEVRLLAGSRCRL